MEESGNALVSGPDGSKRRVSYFYDSDIGNYYYGQGHPMKPHRIRMAHNLIVHYGLHQRMEVCRPHLAQSKDIRGFHTDDYINFLSSVAPDTQQEQLRQLKRFNVGEDCPVFDGLFNFCQSSAGGSIGAALKLNRKDADIAINWSGGLHHAKKCEASGFCYVNDIVLGILELLKVHQDMLQGMMSQLYVISIQLRLRNMKIRQADEITKKAIIINDYQTNSSFAGSVTANYPSVWQSLSMGFIFYFKKLFPK